MAANELFTRPGQTKIGLIRRIAKILCRELKLFGVKYVAFITAVRFFLEVFHDDSFYIFKHRLNLRICGLEDL